MQSRWRALVLHWLRVPPKPHPPAGAPASLQVFRAGENYLKLRLWTWGAAQVVALVGIVFWTAVLITVEGAIRIRHSAPPGATPPAESAAPATAPPPQSEGKALRRRTPPVHVDTWTGFKKNVVAVALLLPAWTFPLVWIVKLAVIALYLAQIPFTYAVRRLDYEMRWYVVTDRSLRIRTGTWWVQELTMSFANLQQVAVTQGPLQRLLGLADVRVQSAGGAGSAHHSEGGGGDTLHTARFHAVDNAAEIRDLILERLRRFRTAGLGDPDDHKEQPGTTAAYRTPPIPGDTLVAAREVLAETRALRRVLSP